MRTGAVATAVRVTPAILLQATPELKFRLTYVGVTNGT
jgi:hypothetical protein